MTVKAELINEIGWGTEPDLSASQVIQRRGPDVEPCTRDKIRHLLANIVLAAKPRRRACVQEAAADASGENAAVEISLGHLLKALASDDRADFLGHAARPDHRQRRLLGLAGTRDAAQRHADLRWTAVVAVAAQFSFRQLVDEFFLADAVAERAQVEAERVVGGGLRCGVLDDV